MNSPGPEGRPSFVWSVLWAWVLREAFGDHIRDATKHVARRLRESRAVRRAKRAAARYLSRPEPPDELERRS